MVPVEDSSAVEHHVVNLVDDYHFILVLAVNPPITGHLEPGSGVDAVTDALNLCSVSLKQLVVVVHNEEPLVLGISSATESRDKANDDATFALASRYRVDLAMLAVLEPVGSCKGHSQLVVVEGEV